MLERFLEIKEIYASKEVSMEELQVIHDSGIVALENRGISRSKKDCLLCEIRYKHAQPKGSSFKVFLRVEHA